MTVVNRKRLTFFVQIKYFPFSKESTFSHLFAIYINIIIPMLRPINSTLEHANTFLSIIWMSLIEKDLRFLSKKRSFSFQKTYFFPLFANLFEKRFFIIPMLKPIYFTFEHANTLISIIRPSLVVKLLKFLVQ